MKQEKQKLEQAKLAAYEYFSSKTDDSVLVRCRKQRELASDIQQAQQAYNTAYAIAMRNKFLQLGDNI